ncbi:hypothetical protein CLCR_10964 [Cladophialophora carrionii]|uniref:Uncharacterized protein n=1 Tax=Cladophialophora carrionii TaxID=86049 RepID=A0A1C1CVM7_9EURO|nr:hypothetical protein CLCR_10964 [Cladophialophora carrionii]
MALAAPAEWLYALATVSWSLTIAFNIYTTPIVTKINSARDQAEIEQMAPKQCGKWTPTPESPECTDYIAPDQDEGTGSGRSSLDDIENDKRGNDKLGSLDSQPGSLHGNTEYCSNDGHNAYGLSPPTRARAWTQSISTYSAPKRGQ